MAAMFAMILGMIIEFLMFSFKKKDFSANFSTNICCQIIVLGSNYLWKIGKKNHFFKQSVENCEWALIVRCLSELYNFRKWYMSQILGYDFLQVFQQLNTEAKRNFATQSDLSVEITDQKRHL